MRTLIVTATELEVAPLLAKLGPVHGKRGRLHTYRYAGRDVDVLTTGVGMVATASWCSHALVERDYDLALNFGACGSFDKSLEPGAVVHVTSDRVAELGAEDGEAFLTIHELNLLGENEFPFTCGQLRNVRPPDNLALAALKDVSGITVNTVHGNDRSIANVVERFRPDVESMEGAAFMYACLIRERPFAQVRAVSNFVERRNRSAWRMGDAIGNLGEVAIRILDNA